MATSSLSAHGFSKDKVSSSHLLLAGYLVTAFALGTTVHAQLKPGETQEPTPAQTPQVKPQAEGKGNSSEGGPTSSSSTEPKPTGPFAGISFRQIGPFRGGRVGAVTGVLSQPMTFYFGATGGGIWKTTDGGIHWAPVADGQLKLGSVGAKGLKLVRKSWKLDGFKA